jgi:hypothetical protein
VTLNRTRPLQKAQGAGHPAALRKRKVPALRFAPVGMTELLREGIERMLNS